jgi:aryl sulfotransferase
LLLHYARLKADLPGEIRRIAAFLGIVIDEQRWPMIVDHCGFDYMKANAERFARHGGSSFKGGAATFIHRGTTDR